MQKTRLKEFINYIFLIISPIFLDTWSKRIILFLSVLSGYYITNSLISFLLDKSINTVFLSVTIVFIMEILIRSNIFSGITRLSLIIFSINNFRIGATYALILEAFKLGS